jgi:hypothetical protein
MGRNPTPTLHVPVVFGDANVVLALDDDGLVHVCGGDGALQRLSAHGKRSVERTVLVGAGLLRFWYVKS